MLLFEAGTTDADLTKLVIRDVMYPQWRLKRPSGWLMYFADNPSAHSFDKEEWAQWHLTHQIKFIAIPENTSHLLDPLDQSTFGYLKKDMRKIQSCINLIHSNPHDFTYQLDPLTLAKIPVPPGSALQRADALTRCLGFENKNTARTRILECEFLLRRIRAEPWKVMKDWCEAGITPYNPEKVLASCDLLRYLPSAASAATPPPIALTSEQAAETIRSIANMPSIDPVERVRLVRDVRDQLRSSQKSISPLVADSALRQLSDPRISAFEVLSVANEILDVTVTPRKNARVHDEQIKEDKAKAVVTAAGLAPKLHRRNLKYKGDDVNTVAQVKKLQDTGALSSKMMKNHKRISH